MEHVGWAWDFGCLYKRRDSLLLKRRNDPAAKLQFVFDSKFILQWKTFIPGNDMYQYILGKFKYSDILAAADNQSHSCESIQH
jgi:hypothetical protein